MGPRVNYNRQNNKGGKNYIQRDLDQVVFSGSEGDVVGRTQRDEGESEGCLESTIEGARQDNVGSLGGLESKFLRHISGFHEIGLGEQVLGSLYQGASVT